MNEAYLYPYSAEYARQRGEESLWRASYLSNMDCKDAIRKAVWQHYDGAHLDGDCLAKVIQEFGYKRTAWVLANTIQQLEWGGQYSSENKEWASRIYIPPDKSHNLNFVVPIRSAVLNGVVDQYRAGGALIAAINVLTDFGNPIMIGGDLALLPTEAYMQINGWYDMSTASVLAVALLIPAVALFLVNRFWVGRRSYVTITGKEISLNPFPVPKWVKWTLFTLTMLISLFVLLVYGTLFYGAFTKTWGYDWSFTWENLQYVFLKGEQIWNSIKYGLLASLGAALLAMVLAYIVQKKQVGLNKFLDFLAILPGAIPGMFLGIGFVLAFNGGWLSLTGTGAIMVLALLFWNLPTCYSAATAGLQQIGASVEDAALNLGANSFRSFKDVIIPLLKAPFLSGFVLSFLRSVTCLSVVIFLYAPSTTVGTISVMVLVQSGQWGEAAAFTVVLITIAFTVLRLAQWILGRQGIKLEL